MAEATGAMALRFHDITFDLVEHASGEAWLRLGQIAPALGYSDPRNLNALYASNAAEFTDRMTDLVKLPTAGGLQEVRIFSLRGAHLLGMFARTERAAEFRRWVLDVLEHQVQPMPPYPPQVIEAVKQLMQQRNALQRHLLIMAPRFKQVVRYHQMADLTQAEKARLMGLKTAESWRELLRQAADMGLIDWHPDAVRSASGKKGQKLAKRINHNASPAHMQKMRQAAAAKRAAAKKGGK